MKILILSLIFILGISVNPCFSLNLQNGNKGKFITLNECNYYLCGGFAGNVFCGDKSNRFLIVNLLKQHPDLKSTCAIKAAAAQLVTANQEWIKYHWNNASQSLRGRELQYTFNPTVIPNMINHEISISNAYEIMQPSNMVTVNPLPTVQPSGGGFFPGGGATGGIYPGGNQNGFPGNAPSGVGHGGLADGPGNSAGNAPVGRGSH